MEQVSEQVDTVVLDKTGTAHPWYQPEKVVSVEPVGIAALDHRPIGGQRQKRYYGTPGRPAAIVRKRRLSWKVGKGTMTPSTCSLRPAREYSMSR